MLALRFLSLEIAYGDPVFFCMVGPASVLNAPDLRRLKRRKSTLRPILEKGRWSNAMVETMSGSYLSFSPPFLALDSSFHHSHPHLYIIPDDRQRFTFHSSSFPSFPLTRIHHALEPAKPKMKTLHITAALLLTAAAASSAQETSPEAAVGPHFGLSYVYEIVTAAAQEATKMMTKHRNYNKAENNYFVRVGTNGIGSTGTPVKSDGTSGMDGPFPLIEVFDSTGTVLTRTEGGRKEPYLDSGEFNRTSSKVVFAGGKHYRMKITAGDDGAPNPNAACKFCLAVFFFWFVLMFS